MEQLIATIEKGQPFFNAIARNKYLKAIRDGFISVIPIIIFSSIFCLVASVPNIWGFYWPDDINNALWKCYNYSMGILAIACAATTAKHFADAQNRDLPKNNQINFISCMCAAIIGFLLLSSDTIATDAASGFNTTYLGSKGLLTAFIAAFVTGIIYKFFIKRNITVKMPEQVPPNISQTFKDIIPFSVCITVFWVFDIVFRAAFGFCFAQGVIQVFQPLFTAADGYIGLAVIYGAMSLFWFVGVHGPSIVEPAIAAALVANMTDNLAAFQAGEHATAVLTQGAQYFVVCMGGTGATLVLVFMFCFNAVFLLMATSLNRNAKLQQENQFLSMQQQRYENLRTAIEEARQARHDMRHQFHQISALAEVGDLENLKSYLAKTVSRIPELDMSFCENQAADSVVGYYCALAKREGIPFCAKLDLPQTLPVDEIDMCLVLSNLLENAFEASLRTAPARRKIEVTAYVHAERLLLVEVENAFDGAVHEKSGVFRSSKRRENGIGIQSVQHIAEKTGGASTFTHQNGIFSAKVMLCGEKQPPETADSTTELYGKCGNLPYKKAETSFPKWQPLC